MNLIIDARRGRAAAEQLHHAFATTGIHGQTMMPEDELPQGVKRGSLEQVLFITLTTSIDYQRDANALWESSRETFEDAETRYLFDPEMLHQTNSEKIAIDLQKHALSKKQHKDANIWRTVGVTFFKKWGGDPRNFLADCNWYAPTVLARLKEDTHTDQHGRAVLDYPYLRGNKIGPLWVRMLRDNVCLTEIRGLERVPIPVDVHVARSTLALGVVRGEYEGPLSALFETIRESWFASVDGLQIDGRPMIALDVDEALWHLSKYGCSHRDKMSGTCPRYARCEAQDLCLPGQIEMSAGQVTLNT